MAGINKIVHAIAFDLAFSDLEIIEQITDRALPMAQRAKVETDRTFWFTLLARAHACEALDLEAIYTAPDKEFAEDIFGIRCFMHETGQYLTEWRPKNLRGPA